MMKLFFPIMSALVSQPSTERPPPPPPIYDPHPGPYLIFTGDDGGLLPYQASTITNLIEAWRGERLSAFLLCFRAREGVADVHAARHSSLTNVTRALKEAGAQVVTIGTSPVCDSIHEPSQPEYSTVIITGIVRS